MSTETKLPAIQFYCADWLRDPVSGCSLSAQGLWLRLIILMHDSPTYGELRLPNGNPMGRAFASRRCGCTLEEFNEAFEELESIGIPSVSEDGLIFSRRMMRDAVKRKRDRERKAEWRSRKQSEGCPEDVPPVSPPSSSSTSTSTSSSASACDGGAPTLEEVKARGEMIGCPPEICEKFFNQYEAQGWVLGNGQRLRNWAAKLSQWATDARTATTATESRSKELSPAQRAFILRDKRESLQRVIRDLEGRYSYEAAMGREWSNKEKRKEWVEAKKKLRACDEESAEVAA